jgi:glycosyltransferase involved in cell wall biosynthesis
MIGPTADTEYVTTETSAGRSSNELVSIVVPVFNAEAYLRQSLESILGQTYPALEVIVMDDASTDGSGEIAAELARTDERVQVHRQPQNVGIFGNVNAGLELANGEFVAFYHADDVYHPEIVARELAFLREHPASPAVFTLAVLMDGAGREFDRMRLPRELETVEVLPYPLLLNGLLRHTSTFLASPSGLVRRKAYLALGGHVLEYGIRSDLDMWLRIGHEGPLGLLHEYLLNYRVADHNESRRYRELRTQPDLFFSVMDGRIADVDGRLVEAGAMRAYEAHRAADLLIAAGNAYVIRDRARLREILKLVSVRRLIASRHVRRGRLLLLYVLLQLFLRLPHSRAFADLLWRRWHGAPPSPRTG